MVNVITVKRFMTLVFSSIFLITMSLDASASESITDKIQKAYDGIHAMKTNFTQVLHHKESGSKENRSGVLYFKKPLLVRWDTKKPTPELLVVSKDAIWNAFPDEELAYKYSIDVAKSSGSLIRVITGQASLKQDFSVKNKGMDKGLAVLDLYPKEASHSMVEARLWVDSVSGLIKKVRIYDFYGNQNEITFSNPDTSVSLNDSLFTYNPPKGYAVEDRSKDKSATPGGAKKKRKK